MSSIEARKKIPQLEMGGTAQPREVEMRDERSKRGTLQRHCLVPQQTCLLLFDYHSVSHCKLT